MRVRQKMLTFQFYSSGVLVFFLIIFMCHLDPDERSIIVYDTSIHIAFHCTRQRLRTSNLQPALGRSGTYFAGLANFPVMLNVNKQRSNIAASLPAAEYTQIQTRRVITEHSRDTAVLAVVQYNHLIVTTKPAVSRGCTQTRGRIRV